MPNKRKPSIAALYGRKQDRYLELIHEFPLRPLRTDSDLDAAVVVIDSLIDQDDLSAPEQDYLDVLSDLVEVYEDQTIPIKPVDDANMLRLLIEAKRVTQIEVAKKAGIAESTISAVLAGKRKLNRLQIGKLARFFHVEPGAFAFAE
jgi:HTH-type transcriptional regulator/antitoxin HigA